MKTTKDQLSKIKNINDAIKNFDPILKERLIDYELSSLFGKEYLEIIASSRNEKSQSDSKKLDVATENKLSPKQKKGDSISIKDFYLEKQPVSLPETVTVFGFYLERIKKIKEFGDKEISDAYYEARVRKPKAIGQALRDAKNIKGYLVEGSKKGKFRISNDGENLVIHDLLKKNA